MVCGQPPWLCAVVPVVVALWGRDWTLQAWEYIVKHNWKHKLNTYTNFERCVYSIETHTHVHQGYSKLDPMNTVLNRNEFMTVKMQQRKIT